MWIEGIVAFASELGASDSNHQWKDAELPSNASFFDFDGTNSDLARVQFISLSSPALFREHSCCKIQIDTKCYY